MHVSESHSLRYGAGNIIGQEVRDTVGVTFPVVTHTEKHNENNDGVDDKTLEVSQPIGSVRVVRIITR